MDRSVSVLQFRRKSARPDNYQRVSLQISNDVRSTPRFRSSSCCSVGGIAAVLRNEPLEFLVRGFVVIIDGFQNLLDIHFTRRSGYEVGHDHGKLSQKGSRMLPAPSAVSALS